ncbi:peritrophin [Planoprotostelium fungivorum]|uniref:Peritrophin n=1 Tax=Planoprotostelium fungivorum TaxID=1890364 RepID=A0A2P6P0I9_9EUKA|nr:peritrophin [Planoprotostelium fungivorum]
MTGYRGKNNENNNMTRTIRTITLTLIISTLLVATQGACPAPLRSCGDACYLESQYCCPNGKLTQKPFCPQATSQKPQSTSSPAATCTTSTIVSQPNCASTNPARDPLCCVGNGTGYSNGYYCGSRHQCSNGVCFLTGASGQNCGPVVASSATQANTAASTPVATAPTGTIACTPVTVVSQSACSYSNPARDLQCCVGNGTGLNNGAFCGGYHQCNNGYCGLTGKAGENCPYTTASAAATPVATAPTGTVACTPVTVVSQPNCYLNNPARDLQCCVGNGTGLNNGAYCGTLHQCNNGYCGLTGRTGENCPYTTASAASTPVATAPTGTIACTPVTVVPQSACSYSNPARDLQCCVGNGTGLNNGAFCGTLHQCNNGYCGLTGKAGENCPYTTASAAATPVATAPTGTIACTPVTVVSQSACSYSNPARDLQCCVGNGTGLNNGAFCGGYHQCNNGYCGLTGKAGENCPYTTASANSAAATPSGSSASNICAGKCQGASCCATPRGSQCFNSATYACKVDDLGNHNVCPSNLESCGQACYSPSQYHCKSGNLFSA